MTSSRSLFWYSARLLMIRSAGHFDSYFFKACTSHLICILGYVICGYRNTESLISVMILFFVIVYFSAVLISMDVGLSLFVELRTLCASNMSVGGFWILRNYGFLLVAKHKRSMYSMILSNKTWKNLLVVLNSEVWIAGYPWRFLLHNILSSDQVFAFNIEF